MKRFTLLLIAIIALLSISALAIAEETPVEDPGENACYTGGDLEGKCDWPTYEEDEWAWACGYYYAALLSVRITESEFPEWCEPLLAKANLVIPTPDNDCVAVDDEYEFNPAEPGMLVEAPGVLANDLVDDLCEVASFGNLILIQDGGGQGPSRDVVFLDVSADGSFEYEVTDPDTIFSFDYTLTSGSTATVTVYHDIDCDCGR
jgi:hypothetical protein